MEKEEEGVEEEGVVPGCGLKFQLMIRSHLLNDIKARFLFCSS